MITIKLYSIDCDPMVLDKSAFFPVSPAQVQGTIRGSVDMMHPEIDIQGDVTGYNYCYIAALHRYYYIDGVEVVRTQLQTIRCRCDVLMSYKDAILTLPAVVDRSAALINSYLPDDRQRVYQYTQANSHRLSLAPLVPAFTWCTDPILITAG